jgi:hypothetical protein
MLALAVGLSIWAVHARPTVGGDDFFSLICFSRDLASGAADVSNARYGYFPGSYLVFRAAITALGGSLATLQWVYLMTLLASAALTGLAAGRVTKSFEVGVVTALLSHGLGLHAQGLDGCIGPLAPVPALAGLAIFGGDPPTGRRGLARACALGAGLGLALAMKQQAGLIALGAAALLVRRPRAPVFLLPAAAIVAFGIVIALEGQGLDPLRIGLGTVQTYGAQGSFVTNVFGTLHHPRALGAAFFASLGAVVAWAWIVLSRPALREEGWVSVLGFSGIAALASFVQFARRDYAHYALIGLPFLAIGLTLLAARRRLVLAGLGVLALALWASGPFPPRFRNDPVVRADLEQIRPLVNPEKDELVVFPLRRNDVHYLLGTRVRFAPRGYSWEASLGRWRDRDWTRVTAVLVSGRDRFAPERETEEETERREVLAFLAGNGFKPVATTETFVLFRR